MAIKLSNNEQIIKEYSYATTTEGIINKVTTQNSLIVTNKRIIKKDVCNKTGHEKLSLSEIPVKAITGLSASMSSSFKFIFLVLGIIFGFAGLMMLISAGEEGAMIIPALLFIAFAAFLIYKFVKTRTNVLICNFVVNERINSAMFVGKVSYNSILSRFAVSGQSSMLRIVVDADVARDFVSEIGALIANIQDISEN